MWGVAKIKKTLKAKVSRMCRTYCLQVWNKALNHAGVQASSALRRAKNVFYPPAIRALGPPSSSSPQAATVSKKADEDKGSPAKIPPSFTSPFKEAKQAKAIGKKKDTSKGVVPDATKPLATPKDPSKGRKTPQHLEIVLATPPMPAKDDSKGKGSTFTAAEISNSTKATRKENPTLRIKKCLDTFCQFFFFFTFFFFFFFCNDCLNFQSYNHFAFYEAQLNGNYELYFIFLVLM